MAAPGRVRGRQAVAPTSGSPTLVFCSFASAHGCVRVHPRPRGGGADLWLARVGFCSFAIEHMAAPQRV
eukprot:7910227-Pyramimonas_sp.AAC.1